MGFQALFKFVKCWRSPDIARETVPSSLFIYLSVNVSIINILRQVKEVDGGDSFHRIVRLSVCAANRSVRQLGALNANSSKTVKAADF